MAALLPRRTLGRTGLSVSVLGFGASPLGGVFEAVDEDEGVASVHEAVRQGINFFDCSPFYGDTRAERVLGRALKDIARDQFVLSTKVGRYGSAEFDFSAVRVTASVEESLERLCVDYIDIIQCHDIEFGSLQQVVEETLPALNALKAAGKVRHVGITGLPLAVFRRVLDQAPHGLVDVVLSYCHYSLVDDTLDALLPYLQERGVGVISASPLCMGLLTSQGPPTWHPAPQALRSAAADAARMCTARGMDLSELAIQFAVRNEGIATTLVGMCTREQVQRNVQCTLAALQPPAAETAAMLLDLHAALQPVKNVTWPSGRAENSWGA